jgi:hypothetical protein
MAGCADRLWPLAHSEETRHGQQDDYDANEVDEFHNFSLVMGDRRPPIR